MSNRVEQLQYVKFLSSASQYYLTRDDVNLQPGLRSCSPRFQSGSVLHRKRLPSQRRLGAYLPVPVELLKGRGRYTNALRRWDEGSTAAAPLFNTVTYS